MSKLSMWLGNKIRTTYEIIIITILNIKGVNAYWLQNYEKYCDFKTFGSWSEKNGIMWEKFIYTEPPKLPKLVHTKLV